MAVVDQTRTWQAERVTTGVPNLDRLLGGGLARGSMLLVVGGPGTGKTVLTEQMAFHWGAQGKSVLWLVTLGEANEKFLTNLSEMSFYDRRQIGATIELVNLTRFLHDGVQAEMNVIRETLRSASFSFVVIDGFQSLRCFMDSTREVRLFLSELGAELALMGITLVITADADPTRYWESPEFTMADCIISLEQTVIDGRQQRQLQVLKLRGHSTIGGPHSFAISRDGVHTYPRLESIVSSVQAPYGPGRQGFDLPGLDHLLNGGPLEGSTTLIMGSPGTGKSHLANHFLAAGLRQGQPSLHVALFELEERILQQADAFDLPFRSAQRDGLLRIIAHEPGDCSPDACAEEIMRDVEARGVRRLVIDSIDTIEGALAPHGRAIDYLSALVTYLRGRSVTSVLTYGLSRLLGTAVDLPEPMAAQVTSNLIMLHFVERGGRLRRFLSVVKMRYSMHSNTIAELLLHEGRVNVVTEPMHGEVEPVGAAACAPGERQTEGGYYPFRLTQ